MTTRMTTEERLRDALAAVAELVQLEEEPAERPAPNGFGRMNRLGPIAVAATVLLIVTVTGIVGLGKVSRPGLENTGSGHYLVAGAMDRLTVRDATTGQVTATVRPPVEGDWSNVSAVADPHMYFAVLHSPRQGRTALYRLTIDDDGRVRTLTRVRDLPYGSAGAASAISPDGTRIAFPRIDPSAKYPVTNPVTGPVEIDLLTLADGRRTVFRTPKVGSVISLSWGADGHHLAFALWIPAESSYSVRVLDTRASGDLIKNAPPVFIGSFTDVPYTTPVLGKDGRTMYLIADDRTGGRRTTQVVEVDLRTGRRLRMLYEQSFYADHGNVGWGFTTLVRDRTGAALLAVDPQGRAHRIDIASGHVSTVPASLGGSSVAW
jgi:dipeptidyl aminopeptidase/acylaminoacyl peptidase